MHRAIFLAFPIDPAFFAESFPMVAFLAAFRYFLHKPFMMKEIFKSYGSQDFGSFIFSGRYLSIT